jgi:hypothetical protein
MRRPRPATTAGFSADSAYFASGNSPVRQLYGGWPAIALLGQFALASRLQLSIGEGAKNMLWTICLVLLVLWALGMATSYTAGGLIHILLVVGLIVLVFRLIQGRRIFG